MMTYYNGYYENMDEYTTCVHCGLSGAATTFMGARFHDDCKQQFIIEYNAHLSYEKV